MWFAKNSDREPGEAQVVEHLPARRNTTARLHCTYIEMEQIASTNEIIISRPFWMWGAEMGANEHGLAIGNEAVFTRLPYAKTGLTGMDLLRLALERTSAAREALEMITSLISEHGQGGACGYRNPRFRYHNSFLIADPNEAWVLETAGPHWAAERVRGVRTISNALSIGKNFDLMSEGAYSFAKQKGWCRSTADFDFACSFGDPFYAALSGGQRRAACTLASVTAHADRPAGDAFFATLTDHAGAQPASGWRMNMPCAHSSWWPARQAGQTTGSMVSRLAAGDSLHWLTGTSSPCLSVFKPVRLGAEPLSSGPAAGAGFDEKSLFWRHEQLHRATLRDYATLTARFDAERKAMQARFAATAGSFQPCWDEHLETIPEWTKRVMDRNPRARGWSRFDAYWKRQNEIDRLPAP